MQEITVKINNKEYKAKLIARGYNRDIQIQGKFSYSGKNHGGYIKIQFIDNTPLLDDLENTITINSNITSSFKPFLVDIDDNDNTQMTFYYK